MEQKKQLGLFDLSMIAVSLVIGMGIFRNPASVAATSGSSDIFFLVWIAGGLIALCGALTYAEIGLRLPVIGGYYKVFAHCYHPAIGFSVNAIILISNAASLAVVALIGADYVSDLLYGKPSGTLFNTTVAIVAVAAFFCVNLFGLKTSSRTLNILTIIKVGLVVLLIASVFKGVVIEPHGYEEGSPLYTLSDKSALSLFLISMIPVCFAYGGYQQSINFGSEVKRTSIIPKGLIIGIIIVVALYFMLNFAYVEVIGFEKMKNASAIGALLCEAWFGPAGAKVFDALMFLSVLAYVNILLMSNPRVMYAMSIDKVFPKIFSYAHPKTGALVAGLATFSLITVIITFFGKGVDNILNFTMFLDSIGMSTSAATLFILRNRKQNEGMVTGTWNKFTPALAAFFVFSYFMIAIGVVIKDVNAAFIGTGLLGLFLGLYFVFYYKKTKVNEGL
ncbi:MAG: APC family permease [Chitinophagaceae bacterium]|nr:MAG: APC family permease [Chitinophagaceae bacterium]